MMKEWPPKVLKKLLVPLPQPLITPQPLIQPHNLGPNNALAREIFDRLIMTDSKQQLLPGLAVSWKAINDLTWEFKLRKGVKFHDGSPFTADDVVFTKVAEQEMHLAEKLGYAKLPVCIAKAPSSLSDDPALRGRPRDFEITVRGININAGAGFIVILTGNIMRMPGLPRAPLAHQIDLDANGEIVGME